MSRDSRVGDLAVVLHTHMPYVEGFGTYPFGEEWLFDAVARSHLPVLAVADRLTMTVTPVLADQLEADGVGERMLEFLKRHRLGAAQRDAAGAEPELRAAAEAEAEHYAAAIARLDELGGDALGAFQEAGSRGPGRADGLGRDPRRPAEARDARRAQAAARRRACARTERRFGPPAGVWLPECAYAPGHRVAAGRARASPTPASTRARTRRAARRSRRCSFRAGPSRSRSTGRPSSWSGRTTATRRPPSTSSTTGSRARGAACGRSRAGRTTPAAARERARADARAFLAAVRERLERYTGETGRRGLCVFAIDTELLGHWWSEGPWWLEELVARRGGGGGADADPARGARRARGGRAARSHEGSWGEGKSLETWDSPGVADLAWGARRLELRMLRAMGDPALGAAAAERAARELLAVQSSDWAFMDHRGQAGDYPYRRTLTHAEAMLEAIDSSEAPEPGMRNLAPDLSLAPLLEP